MSAESEFLNCRDVCGYQLFRLVNVTRAPSLCKCTVDRQTQEDCSVTPAGARTTLLWQMSSMLQAGEKDVIHLHSGA